MKEENKRLRKCVEFYANKENWYDIEEIEGSDRRTISHDSEDLFNELNYHIICGGKLARKTLEELKWT